MGISKDNTRVLLILPKKVKEQLEDIAQTENRSVNNLIRTIIYNYLKERN